MKKRAVLSATPTNAHSFMTPLLQLNTLLEAWNKKIDEVTAARRNAPEALSGVMEDLGLHCGEILAGIEAQMEPLTATADLRKLVASLVECKKMEIRRAAISVTEMVEKNTHKRLHTHLFFATHDSMDFGEGLDEYKDIMEELMRRLELMHRLGTLDAVLMQRLVMELKTAPEMFAKKRASILEKAGVSIEYLPYFSALIDHGLKMLKPKMGYHQISLATFHPERSIRLIAENMGAFFDDVHSHGKVQLLAHTTAHRRKRITKTMLPPMQGGMMERRASA